MTCPITTLSVLLIISKHSLSNFFVVFRQRKILWNFFYKFHFGLVLIFSMLSWLKRPMFQDHLLIGQCAKFIPCRVNRETLNRSKLWTTWNESDRGSNRGWTNWTALNRSEINGDSSGDKRAAISFELGGVSDVALCLMQGGRSDLGKLFLISTLYAKFFK